MDRSWEPGESLGEWIKRRLKEKQWNVKDLAENTSLGLVTIYRMLKSEEFYIARSNTREALAWNRRTGLENLGYFGYPPIQVPDKELNNGLALNPEEKEELIHDDFASTIQKCDYVRQPCIFCQLAPESFAEECESEEFHFMTDPEIVKPLTSADVYPGIHLGISSLFFDKDFFLVEHNGLGEIHPNEVSKRVFVSTNTFKKYGVIRESYAKTFELALDVCRECIRQHWHVFTLSVPELVRTIMYLYNLNQDQLATYIGFDNGQGVISKLLNTSESASKGTEFVHPNTLKRLIGVYVNGTPELEVCYDEDQNYWITSLESDLITNGFKTELSPRIVK